MKAATKLTPGATVAVLGLFAGTIAAPAPSAAAAGAPAAAEPLKLERFEVTGSYLPFASTQTALPLTIVDSQAIDDTGIATSVLDVLRKLAPPFSGNGNIGNANAGPDLNTTAGGAKLAFRNTQTLVLVNGRRMAYAPTLASGGQQFVDVNLLPLAAIERIEVLQDGASATYGTDAVGGVVNIILKADFRGFEAAARYGIAPGPGRYAERSFSIVGGAGAGRAEITVAAEYAHSDPLFQYNRSFATPAYGTLGFAGVINTRPGNTPPRFYLLNPALNAPPAGHSNLADLVAAGVYVPVNAANLANGKGPEAPYAFNLANSTMLLLENDRRSATLNIEHRVSDRLSWFGDFIYTKTASFTQLNAQPLMASLPPDNSSNPTTQPMQVRNRFVDHPRLFFYDSTSIRGVAGARGTLGPDCKWEAAVDRNVIEQNYTNPNVVDSTLRAAAIAHGLIDLAAREQAPGTVAAAGLFGTAWGRARSALTGGDARVSGHLGDLPAGPVGFAVGAEYRVETLRQVSDVNSQTATFNWDAGWALNPFGEHRNVWSTFAEVRLPLLGEAQALPLVRSLEASAAVRHERYSDTDDPTVPKFSLAWRPRREGLLIRATYSRSFAAPTLFELFGPAGVADAAQVTFNTPGGAEVTRELHVRSGANPALRPSRSRNLTFGFVWSPHALKGFSLTADYFDIRQEDLVASIDLDTIVRHVELNGGASPYARFVKVGGFDGAPIAAPGQISADLDGNIYVTDSFVNIANQDLRGGDAKAEYSHQVGALGRFDATVSATSYQSYSYRSLPGVAAVETAGRATAANGTIPRWQGNVAVAWHSDRWRATLDWRHIPGVDDAEGDGTARKPFAIRAYDSLDASIAYAFDLRRKWLDRLVLRVGVNNLCDRMPPFGGGTFSGTNADTGTYSPIGRLLFVEGKYRF